MKKLTLLFLLIPFLGFGQVKGDNTVIIPNFEKVKIQDLKKVLVINGYEIEDIDTTLGFFSTKEHPVEGSVHAYNLKVRIIGNFQEDGLHIFANYTFGGGSSQTYSGRAEFHNRKLIGKRLAFDELVQIAKKINPVITYKKE